MKHVIGNLYFGNCTRKNIDDIFRNDVYLDNSRFWVSGTTQTIAPSYCCSSAPKSSSNNRGV
eukprot:1956114-Amphidinium_carterae.1